MAIKQYFFLGGLITLLLLSCQSEAKKEIKPNTLPYFNTMEMTPEWNKPEHKVADFKFINQEGKTVSQIDYKGKIYVSSFFFTSCAGICNQLIANMSVLQDHFKNDEGIKFISHSVTPEIDSIAQLKKYADYKNINAEQWSLITGDKEKIYKLARDSYFSDEDFITTKKPSSFIHSENFLLIDTNGHIRGVYNGTLRLEMKRIIKHIALLKQEK